MLNCPPSTYYYSANNDFIFLFGPYGGPCASMYAVPIKGGKILDYSQPLAIDLKRNLIAYIHGEPEAEGYSYIGIENMKTKKRVVLKEYDWCPYSIQQTWIICSYFENKDFVISWNGSKCSDTTTDIKTRRIQIDF